MKKHLKALLLQLAMKCDNPGRELQIILAEVINDLHRDVQEQLKKKRHLRVIGTDTEMQ
ncbi:MAG: hypothetical protein ACXWPM_11790 [Bdellovibrionota bacterium]